MNHQAEICTALLNDTKLKLFSSVCDRVGISEKVGTTQINALCAEGVLRRERDYVHVVDESKARTVSGSTTGSVHSIAAARAVRKHKAMPVIPIPANITVDEGIPIPAKKLGKVFPPNPFQAQFSTMRVGASFAIPVPQGVTPRDVGQMMRTWASRYRRTAPGLRVTIRTEQGDKSVRLWREQDAESKETPAARASKGIRLPIAKRPGTSARA